MYCSIFNVKVFGYRGLLEAFSIGPLTCVYSCIDIADTRSLIFNYFRLFIWLHTFESPTNAGCRQGWWFVNRSLVQRFEWPPPTYGSSCVSCLAPLNYKWLYKDILDSLWMRYSTSNPCLLCCWLATRMILLFFTSYKSFPANTAKW